MLLAFAASRFDTLLQLLALFQRCTVVRLLRLSYAAARDAVTLTRNVDSNYKRWALAVVSGKGLTAPRRVKHSSDAS